MRVRLRGQSMVGAKENGRMRGKEQLEAGAPRLDITCFPDWASGKHHEEVEACLTGFYVYPNEAYNSYLTFQNS